MAVMTSYYSIIVSHPQFPVLDWRRNIPREAYERLLEFTGKSSVDFLTATLTPVRTNNLKNFASDLFLPTTINQAIRVNNAIAKVFAILAALLLDVLTFPIRLCVCLPRYVHNAIQPEEPLHVYLRAQGADDWLLQLDCVKVVLSSTHRSLQGEPIVNNIYTSRIVNFIPMPEQLD